MGEVIFRGLAAFVFASILVLSPHHRTISAPGVPCYDPAPTTTVVTP